MAATPQQVRDLSLAGTFNALSDGQITGMVVRAAMHMRAASWQEAYPDDVWQATFDHAHALLAAHLIQRDIDEASGGSSTMVVTSSRLGPASRTRTTAAAAAVMTNDPSDLQLHATRWGQEYLALRPTGGRALYQ